MYFDKETNLCYNRYRYYSPETGGYLSQDPIRLAGNNPTLYGYVYDANSMLDVFGLNGDGYVFRGDNGYKLGNDVGLPLGSDADITTIRQRCRYNYSVGTC